MKYFLAILCLFQSFNTFSGTYSSHGKIFGCSGFLLKLASFTQERKAIFATNSHCLASLGLPTDMPKQGEVRLMRPMAKRIKLVNEDNRIHKFKSEQLLFSTMSTTDLAILELSYSYEQLEKRFKIKPLLLTLEKPSSDLELRLISLEKRQVFSCGIEKIVPELREGGRSQYQVLALSSNCQPRAGTSGSAVVSQVSREVVAINSTINLMGLFCLPYSPCEIYEGGKILSVKYRAYAQQIALLNDCFQGNEFKPWDSQCFLAKYLSQ